MNWVPAIIHIWDSQIRNIIDALSEQNGYEGYPEAISEIFFKGIESMIKSKSGKEDWSSNFCSSEEYRRGLSHKGSKNTHVDICDIELDDIVNNHEII